jgi:hypothetical protein
MQDFKLSQQINALQSSWAISCTKVELKTYVSKTCSVSIIRVNVEKENKLEIFISVLTLPLLVPYSLPAE